MNCRRAKGVFADHELKLASPWQRSALDDHLGQCPACAAWARRERRLTSALAALDAELPFEVDVTQRVRSGVGRRRALPGREVAFGELAGSAVAAAATLAALGFGLWRLAPMLPRLFAEARLLASAIGSALTTLWSPLATVLSAAARSARTVLTALEPSAGTLETLQAVMIATVALCALTMATSIVLVVGHDLRRSRLIGEETRP